MIKYCLYVGIGGFLGSVTRYLLSQYVDKRLESLFPYGTFTVNILGCLLLGVLYAQAEKEHLLTYELRMLLAVGFCGSFTTFSTFAYEKIQLIEQGEWPSVLGYGVLSVCFGLLATLLGGTIGKLL